MVEAKIVDADKLDELLISYKFYPVTLDNGLKAYMWETDVEKFKEALERINIQ